MTWRDSDLGSVRKRQADLDEFLRQRAAHEHRSLSAMPLVIRWERGQQTERPHCHFLLSGFPAKRVTKNESHTWNALWYHGHGLARVRPWEPALRAGVARYMLPGVETEVCINGANEYEVCRFDSADSLVINDAAWERWQSLRGVTFDVARCT
jgi:hypothetical protein